jgi:glycosyltransferase involved in cell wall biosynthesis
MKIGIEAQRLFRPKKHGMDLVALELIKNLQLLDHTNEYVVFVRPDADDGVLRETRNFRIVRLDGGSYPVWEQILLPKSARREGCDILHCTSNTAPLFSSIPLVITLHDIIYLESGFSRILMGGGTAYQKFGNTYRKMVVPGVVSKSRKIITVSHSERQRISNFFGMNGDKRLVAVHNGVSEYFHPVSDPVELATIKMKYGLPDEFFFFLGNTDPKKNTRGTICAYSEFVRATGSSIFLVMPDYDREDLDRIITGVGDPAIRNRIKLTGYISNTDLPAIYSQCKAFLYPSLRESFGIPILEAMACGAPVITSNTSSMPEIAGDAAALANPSDPKDIARHMQEVVSDPGYRKRMISLGLQQSARFSWRSMARKVLEIYTEIGSSIYSNNNTKRI